MSRRPRPRNILLSVLAALVVVAVFAVLIWDWSWFKGPAARAASDALGREVTVAGELDVDLGIETRVVLSDVAVGNTTWGEADKFAKAERIEAVIRLPALIVGNIDIMELVLVRPDVALERNADGAANWNFKAAPAEEEESASKDDGALPLIRRIRIEDGTVRYDDRQSGTQLALNLQSVQATPGVGGGKLEVQGQGRYQDRPFDLSLKAGSVYELAEGIEAYPVDLQATIGEHRITAQGTLTRPLRFRGFDLNVEAEGPNLGEIAAIAHLDVPTQAAYGLKGRIAMLDGKWTFEKVTARLGDSKLAADGILARPFGRGPADLNIDLEGSNLAELVALSGAEIPATPAFGLEGRVEHKEGIWGLRDFTARLGESVVTGQLRYESPAEREYLERPLITGELVSDTIRYSDFAAFTEGDGATEAEGESTSRVIPDISLDRPELKALDVDVRLRIRTVANTQGTFDALNTHILLKGGRLALEKVDLRAAGSSFTGSVALDTSKSPATARLAAEMDNLDLALILPQDASDTVSGHLGGRVDISGTGDSLVPLLESLKGGVTAFLSGGRLNEFLAEAAGLDILGTMRSMMNDRTATTDIRCMVADFGVDDGLMTSKALVLDTDALILTGNGTISLPREKLDLTLTPRAKGVNPLSFSTPLAVAGSFKDPTVGPKVTGLGFEAGKTLALGLFLGPLAALVPMVESKLAGDGNCGALLDEAKDGGKEKTAPPSSPQDGDAPAAP